MGLLDGLVKGAAATGLIAVASKVINENGGIDGLMKKFQEGGLGNIFGSWVSTGENQAVTPTQVQQTLGPDQIQKLAQELGIPADQLSQHLSELLPHVVDKMTPAGQVPQGTQAQTSPDAIKKILGMS